MMKIVPATLIILIACTGGQEGKTTTGEGANQDNNRPEPTPTQPPPVTTTEEKPELTITISSVHLAQDCPTSKAEKSDKSKQKSAAGRNALGHCNQSTIQLEVKNLGSHEMQFIITRVRMLSDKAEELAELDTREASIWKDNQYQSWDERVPAKSNLRVNYKVSIPNWHEVEETLGKTSFGPMFQIEMEVKIDGKVQSIQSPNFARSVPDMVKT